MRRMPWVFRNLPSFTGLFTSGMECRRWHIGALEIARRDCGSADFREARFTVSNNFLIGLTLSWLLARRRSIFEFLMGVIRVSNPARPAPIFSAPPARAAPSRESPRGYPDRA